MCEELVNIIHTVTSSYFSFFLFCIFRWFFFFFFFSCVRQMHVCVRVCVHVRYIYVHLCCCHCMRWWVSEWMDAAVCVRVPNEDIVSVYKIAYRCIGCNTVDVDWLVDWLAGWYLSCASHTSSWHVCLSTSLCTLCACASVYVWVCMRACICVSELCECALWYALLFVSQPVHLCECVAGWLVDWFVCCFELMFSWLRERFIVSMAFQLYIF